jgi:MFS family permease
MQRTSVRHEDTGDRDTRPLDREDTSGPPAAPRGSGPARANGERSLLHSIRDGCGHAVMLGCGEAYLPPFAIGLGAGSLVVGLLASLPLFVGAATQLGSVFLLGRISRRKPLVTIPAFLQGLWWLPLLVLPVLSGSAGPAVLLVCALVYFALGGLTVPAWNSWMGDLVAPERRGAYFGRRDRLRTISQLIAVTMTGVVLAVASGLGAQLAGFAVVFAIALFARLYSARELARMDEPAYVRPSPAQSFTLRAFLRRLPRSNFGRFTSYVAAMQAATYLSSPFFALYMLRDLEFTYLEFTAASTVYVLAQALTFQNWGRLVDRFGSFNVLRLAGLLVPVVPLLWLISPRFEAILVYQLISGLVWAGFNLSSANFIFDSVSPPKRARCVAYHNLLVNGGIFAGALAGGWLAPHLPDRLPIAPHPVELASHLQFLFLVSGAARLVVSLAFLPLIREERGTERPGWGVILQVVGLSPLRGFRFSIFHGVHRRELERPDVRDSTERDTRDP